jgi:hypothetical protein
MDRLVRARDMSVERLVVAASFAVLAAMAPAEEERFCNPRVAGEARFLGFAIGGSTLAEIQARLGPSEVRRCSQEEEAEGEVCYAMNGATVVFLSGFSGGWSQLDGYRVIADGHAGQCYSRCPAASVRAKALQTAGGLRLGLDRASVLKLFGRPVREADGELTFRWLMRVPFSKGDMRKGGAADPAPMWDVQDTITITLSANKVIDFAVDHTVSN